jgi:hypothetical protein
MARANRHYIPGYVWHSKLFIEEVKKSLGFRAKAKSVTEVKGHYQLREDVFKFGNASQKWLEPDKSVAGSDVDTTNTFLWKDIS